MHDADSIEAVLRYHQRTKHHFNRYAPGPGELDWANQTNPFRRYEGAPLLHLPILGPDEAPHSPFYEELYRSGAVPSAALTLRSLSRLLQYALAISAWKQAGATRWALRCNPSSGNLHPTEGCLLIAALPGLGETPGLYHYAAREHGLERRADCSAALFAALLRELPPQAFLVGLSSIHWREAWKYGERAFRYCQHDVGHAIGTLRIAAATLGWSALLLDGLADPTIEDLLGLNRAEDFAGVARDGRLPGSRRAHDAGPVRQARPIGWTVFRGDPLRHAVAAAGLAPATPPRRGGAGLPRCRARDRAGARRNARQ